MQEGGVTGPLLASFQNNALVPECLPKLKVSVVFCHYNAVHLNI